MSTETFQRKFEADNDSKETLREEKNMIDNQRQSIHFEEHKETNSHVKNKLQQEQQRLIYLHRD